MGTPRFTPEFKEEAVRQITERGYSVAEISDRPGVSAHSLYKWLRSIKPDNSEQHTRDLLEVKSETEATGAAETHPRRAGYPEKVRGVIAPSHRDS